MYSAEQNYAACVCVSSLIVNYLIIYSISMFNDFLKILSSSRRNIMRMVHSFSEKYLEKTGNIYKHAYTR